MRSVLTLLLAACLGLALTGCAFMSDEDRDFYGKGWINPRELDAPMKHHAIPNPESASDPAVANQANPIEPAASRDEWEDPMPAQTRRGQ